MTTRQFRQQQVERATEWFSKHRAEYAVGDVGGVVVERLKWKAPGTRNYRCDYACVGGVQLFVAGDIGEAVYLAGAKDLAWWARCHVDYFAGKCEASEHGKGYKSWDDDEAMQRLDEELKRMADERDELYDEDNAEGARMAIREGRGEWESWMRTNASDLFGDEWWDFVPNFGVTVDSRCVGHLVGLKLAIAQLAAAKAEGAA